MGFMSKKYTPFMFRKHDSFSREEWAPKEEGHHSDASGKGPANTWIIRDGHELIHQSVADACRILGEPTKGFCGDPTTLKQGNRFFNDFSSPSVEETILANMFKKYNPLSEEESPLADMFKKHKKHRDPFYGITNFKLPEPEKKESSLSELARRCKDYFSEQKTDSPSYDYLPSYTDILHKKEPKKEKSPLDKLRIYGINFSLPEKKESPLAGICRSYRESLAKKTDSFSYRANQDHWLGRDKSPIHETAQNSWSLPNSWSLQNRWSSPVLEPVDITRDPSFVAYQSGKAIIDNIMARQASEKANFERNNPGQMDFENNLYARNMVSLTSIPRTTLPGYAPPLPSVLLPRISL